MARVTITKPRAALAVGTGLTLQAHAEMANGDPRTDQQVKWVSLRPDVASIDESGFVVGQAVGTAMLEASVGDVKASTSIDVVKNPVRELSITPKTTRARTGDVVRFESVASGQANARVSAVARWSVSGVGATIDADGGFVAERPGSYAVTATIGDRRQSLASLLCHARWPVSWRSSGEHLRRNFKPPSSGSLESTPISAPSWRDACGSTTFPIRRSRSKSIPSRSTRASSTT